MSQLFADDEAAYLKQLELEDEQDNQQSLSQGEEEDDEEAYLKRLEQEDAQDQDETILSQKDTDNEEAYLRQLELEDAQADGVVSPAPVSATASVTQTSVAEEPITPTPNQDTAMIDEYLQDSNAFYSREYLSGLDTQKLSEVLNEEQPALVDKYYPVSGQGITPEQVDEISEGAELVDYTPSWREKSQSAIASGLQKTGIASDNFTAQSMAQDFVGNANATSLLEGFSAADFSPVNAVFALNEIARDVENISNREDSEATDYIEPAIFAALSILEAGIVTKGAAKFGKNLMKPAVEIAEDIEKKAFRKSKLGKSFKKLTDRRAAQEQTREAIFAERASKFDVTAAREASAASQAEKAAAAKVLADKRSEMEEE